MRFTRRQSANGMIGVPPSLSQPDRKHEPSELRATCLIVDVGIYMAYANVPIPRGS